MKFIVIILALFLLIACKEENKEPQMEEVVVQTVKKSFKQIKEELLRDGYKTFDYMDEATKDTVIMQQYFMVFLKSGPNTSQNKAETDSLQSLHQAHLGRMYNEGYADLSGPFADDGEIRGVTVYNTPTLEMADSLARLDPMVKSGRLVIEIHPWWAGKGFPLR